MNESEDQTVEPLVLAVISGNMSLSEVLSRGFTYGRVMRALVAAKEAGLIESQDGVSVLTEAGTALLQKLKHARPKSEWIKPMSEKKMEPLKLSDIWLPEPSDIID